MRAGLSQGVVETRLDDALTQPMSVLIDKTLATYADASVRPLARLHAVPMDGIPWAAHRTLAGTFANVIGPMHATFEVIRRAKLFAEIRAKRAQGAERALWQAQARYLAKLGRSLHTQRSRLLVPARRRNQHFAAAGYRPTLVLIDAPAHAPDRPDVQLAGDRRLNRL